MLHFTDSREAFYFRAYQEGAATELSGILRSSAWNYTLLQSCYREPFVLRAVVAIGALNKAVKTEYLAHGDPKTMQVARQHREFALASYDKAIVGMKHTKSLRNTLLACLLVHCIELFLQSPNTAFCQSQTGYALLQKWLAEKQSSRNEGLRSPDSIIIEDEIFHEFKRLDLEHAVRWGEHGIDRHSSRRKEGAATVKNMPSRFGHLDEARLYNELIFRRTFHLIGETYARIMEENRELRHLFASENPGEFVDPCSPPTMLFETRDAYLDDIRRWSEAFAALYKKLQSSPDAFISGGAVLLRVHILNAEIALTSAFTIHECDFDRFLPAFTEIVTLARQIETRTSQVLPKDNPVFMFAQCTERPLFNVAQFCRDCMIRQEAIRILRDTEYLDPTKDQARLVTRACFLSGLEEAGRLTDGTIPESARWRVIWTLNHYKEQEKHLTLLACRRIDFPLGKQYPARREWKRRTFTKEEAERMLVSPWREEMHWAPWPSRILLTKPVCIAWREVLDQLLAVRTGSTLRSRIL